MQKTLTTKLLPHQSACVERILDVKYAEREQEQSGVVVSLLWGAGKTLTSIEAALIIGAQRPSRLPILVLTDVSTVEDWIKNAQEHYSPSLSVTFVSGKAHVGTSAAIMNWHMLCRQDIIVTNVEILVGFCAVVRARRRRLIQQVLDDEKVRETRKAFLRAFLATNVDSLATPIPDEELAAQETCNETTDARFALLYTRWPVIIIDEAHKVRNSDSIWFSALAQLRDDFRISLTATPFNNSIKDVVSVLAITNIAPPSRRSCRQHEAIVDEWTSLMDHPETFCLDFTQARDRYIIQNSAGTTVDRQHYRPVDMILRVPFDTEAEREHYRIVAAREKENMLKTAVRLKQTCSGIFDHETSADYVWPDMEGVMPTKIRAVICYLEVTLARREKVNIMCEYRASLEQLRERIKVHFGSRLTVYSVDGSTTTKERQKIRTLYEIHRGAAVLIVTSVFNQGVNLHCANHTILFNAQWNPVVADQSRSRCERPAQTRSVFSVQIVIADTIEDQIWEVAAAKRKTNKEVMLGMVTPELLQRVIEQDDECVPIEEQLSRVTVSSTERTMRENCTHFIDCIDSLSAVMPPTTLIPAVLGGERTAMKRMERVGVVVNGKVVVRCIR